MTNNKDIWYNKSKLLSHNTILNFLIGQRGGGKTYGFKTWCIDDFLKNGNQFLWLRRYKTELHGTSKELGVVQTWFNDVAHLYPDVELEIKGGVAYINGEIAGYFGALSISEHWKSIPFNKVNKVVYDEFLIRTGLGKQYLKNEATIFLELMETVGRMRENVRYFLVGNALSFVNPYFTYFGIKPFTEGIKSDKKRGITVELYSNKKFTEVKESTRFGKLVKGTDFGDYAIGNEFLLDNEKFISEKTPKARHMFNVSWDNSIIGIWIDYDTGYFYCSTKYNKERVTYSIKAVDHDINMFMIGRNNVYLKQLKRSFELGYLYFENQLIKSIMMNITGVL